MRRESRVCEEFGELIREIKGQDSFGQAEIKTGISQAYLLAMGRGKVPQPDIIRKFAAGYADRHPDLEALLRSAGYEYEHPKPDMVREQMAEYLVNTGRLTPDEAKKVLSELQKDPVDLEEWHEGKSA